MRDRVPEGWHLKKLGDLTTLITKGTTPQAYANEGINFIKVESISSNKTLVPEKFAKIDADTHQKQKRSQLENGDIIFAIAGSLGRLAVIKSRDLPANTNQALAIIRLAKNSIDMQFCLQQLGGNRIQSRIKNLKTVGAQPNLSLQQVSDFTLFFPPLPEQKKIASILTSVDEVIENTQKQIDKLQDLKKATMNELLTKGIGHTEFKDSELGKIPKSWEVKPVSEICLDIIDCVNKTAPIVDYKTSYKMLRTTNVRDGEIDTENVRYVTKDTFDIWTRRGALRKNDIIFTREAPVGETGIVDEPEGLFLGQRTMMYRVHPLKTNPKFLLFAFQSEYCKKQLEDMTGGSTVGHMRVPDCSKILFAHCPKTEQDKIASIIFSQNRNITALKRKLSQTQSLKKSLMQDLLTGKVRVKVN